MTDQAIARRTLSLAEAAEMLGIGRSTAYRLAQQGALPVPVLEIGPVLRVSLVHVERYLETGLPVRPPDEHPVTV
jgi:excisionase family DNA binding protein